MVNQSQAMLVQVIVDTAGSWNIPYAQQLSSLLRDRGHTARFIESYQEVIPGDILVLLGCTHIAPQKVLAKNRHNLVVHASALPQGRGFSPLTWQILEGKSEIPVTLFEAAADVDAGLIYASRIVTFKGHELIDELRAAIGQVSLELVLEFVDVYPNISGKEQQGTPSNYRRRVPGDSRLSVSKSLAGQFNLLRVVDNEEYPAFFDFHGEEYILKIYKRKRA